VPIAGPQSILGGGVVINSTQYLDTGIILTVTPRISAGGLVTLEVQQEVSNALNTTSSTLNSPTISRRAARSQVTVRSGDTTVLGGLIQENRSNNSSGIPFLSKIPIIGALFGLQDYSTRKTELVVLITPRIAPNVGQARAVSEEFRRRLGAIEEMLDEQRRREAEKTREPG
jgi:general secretion pathway protein D